jgi:hypothetical protein
MGCTWRDGGHVAGTLTREYHQPVLENVRRQRSTELFLISCRNFLSSCILECYIIDLTDYQAFSQGPKRGRPILVQRYIYSKGGGGGRENVPLKNLWSLRYFMSVSVPSSFEIFQTHLALWVCAAMLLYLTTTFSFSQVHHQIDQNVKCIIIMRIEAISFQIY